MNTSVRLSIEGQGECLFSGKSASGTRSDEVGASILVIDGNLLTAETFVIAASYSGYTGSFLFPVAAEHLRAQLATSAPDVAVVDIDSISAATCFELLGILRKVAVPVIAMGGKLEILAKCVNAGASYAIDKRMLFSECVKMIGGLVDRKPLMKSREESRQSSVVQEDIRARRALLAPFEILTYREKCVLAALMNGHGAESIAAEGSVCISTVRSQIKAILQKLGVNSQLAATALANHAGWAFEADGQLDAR